MCWREDYKTERTKLIMRGNQMIDLSHYSVVDGHCHPFLPERERGELDQLLNLSTIPIPRLHSENIILYRKVMMELARVLGCPLRLDEILRRRREEYARPAEYIGRLFEEAKIDTLLLDTGYPRPPIPLEEFRRLVRCRVRCIYRLEPLISRLFQSAPPFDELLERYEEALESAVRDKGYVGFKSVIAYGFGLRIQRVEEGSAREAYERLRDEGVLTLPLRRKSPRAVRDEKTLRNYLVCRGIEKSIDLDVPFQIHTGIGDSPYIDLREANPLHLFDVIRDEELGKAKIVLVHAGYPYVEEAGFLANNYPNVYIDLSEMIPFIGPGMREKILQLLYMSPTTKILYGSDGYNIPEIFWISAIWGKQALSEALQELVESGAIDEDYAYKAGRLILWGNAVRLYKLPPVGL